jgi:hypothetical protein
VRSVTLLLGLGLLSAPAVGAAQEHTSVPAAGLAQVLDWVLVARQNLIPDSAKADFCRIATALGGGAHAIHGLSPRARGMISGGREGCTASPAAHPAGISRWWRLDAIDRARGEEIVVRATLFHPGGSNSETYVLRCPPEGVSSGGCSLRELTLSDFVYN